MKRLIGIFLLSAALLLVTTCSEPIDFVNEVETEVKIANDLFLEVVSFSPGKGAENINPQDPLEIEFDRSVALTSVSSDTVYISDGTSGLAFDNPDFNSVTNVLTIRPETPFQSEHSYTITVNGVRGTDNSSLQESVSWGFTTGKFPAGSFTVISQNPASLSGYTDSRTVNIGISVNDAGSSIDYVVSENENFGDPKVNGSLSALTTTTVPFELSTGEGNKTVWFRVSCTIGGTYIIGNPVAVNIKLDSLDPVVSGVSLAGGASYSTSTAVPLTYSVSDAGSSSLSELFVKVDTTDIAGLFTHISSSPVSTNAYFGAANYVNKSATVTVYDRAGNYSQASDSIYIDSIPPNAPSVSGTTPTLDRTPTWNWSTGGNGGAGVYQYRLNSGDWSTPTTANSFTPGSSLAYGNNTVYVVERDARYNWSPVGSKIIYISPVYPFNKEKGVSLTPTIQWPYTFLATYDLQILNGKIWATVAPDLDVNYFTVPSPGLQAGTTYTWRYVTRSRGSTIYSTSYIFTTAD